MVLHHAVIWVEYQGLLQPAPLKLYDGDEYMHGSQTAAFQQRDNTMLQSSGFLCCHA
jgi:hypothetical protein